MSGGGVAPLAGAGETSAAVQDYVKAIWRASGLDGGGGSERSASTGDIAEQLGVSPASVSGMVRRLESDGLVERTPYRGVRLTARGRRIALEVVRHHRLLETFLARALGMPWDEIHAEAEVLEHHISEDLEARIDAWLGYPEFDPHGHPIPRRDGTVPGRGPLQTLADGAVGTRVRIAQIRNDSPEVLRFLAAHRLTVGACIVVRSVEPAIDVVTIDIEGGDDDVVVLGLGLAARIDVE